MSVYRLRPSISCRVLVPVFAVLPHRRRRLAGPRAPLASPVAYAIMRSPPHPVRRDRGPSVRAEADQIPRSRPRSSTTSLCVGQTCSRTRDRFGPTDRTGAVRAASRPRGDRRRPAFGPSGGIVYDPARVLLREPVPRVGDVVASSSPTRPRSPDPRPPVRRVLAEPGESAPSLSYESHASRSAALRAAQACWSTSLARRAQPASSDSSCARRCNLAAATEGF